MKKLTGLILFALILSFVGCQEEAIENEQALVKQKPEIDVLYYNNGKSEQAKMLVFESVEAFQNKVLDLRWNSEQYVNDVVKQYSNLDDEKLNEKLLEIKFDDYKPLKDFENVMGFKSALSKYLEAENEWLRTENLDYDKDPDIIFNGLEADEMVLLSPDLSVKIGDAIIVQKADGKIRINDGKLETFEEILYYKSISDIKLENYDNIEVNFSKGIPWSPTCTTGGNKVKYWEVVLVTTHFKMKGKARHSTGDYFLGTQLYAKTKYYKKGWTGIWRGYKTDITVSMEGPFDKWLPFPGVNHCGDGIYGVNHSHDVDHDPHADSIHYGLYFLNQEILTIEIGQMEAFHHANTQNEYQSFN